MASSTVTTGHMNGWSFVPESGATFSGRFAPCPVIGGYDCGARLEVDDSASGGFIGAGWYAGLQFASIITLMYSTFVQANGGVQAPSLQFDVAADVTNPGGYQGRAVFEPYLTGATVTLNQWQRWDVTKGAGWWFTKAPLSNFASQASPKSWAQILAAYPLMGVHPSLPLVAMKAGSGWASFVGFVNDLIIATAASFDRWLFVPTPNY